jgi:myosin-1
MREIIVTENSVFIIGAEKQKNGPNKGKVIKVVKRNIPFADISSLSLSTKCDDIFVIHTPNDYDSVLETVFKTELVTVVSEKYQLKLGRNLSLNFKDDIEYSVKKTTWQAGGKYEIHFVHDETTSTSFPEIVSSGKSATIRIAAGLPKDSRPVNRSNDIKGVYQAAKQGNRNPSFQAAKFNNPIAQNISSVSEIPYYANSNLNNAPSLKNFNNSNTSIGGSNSSLGQDAAKKKMPPPPPPKKTPMVKAIYDYDASEADELTIRAGDLIVLLSKDDPGWWTGSLNGKKGLFPSNYVQDT